MNKDKSTLKNAVLFIKQMADKVHASLEDHTIAKYSADILIDYIYKSEIVELSSGEANTGNELKVADKKQAKAKKKKK